MALKKKKTVKKKVVKKKTAQINTATTDKSILDQRELWTISENESLKAVIEAGVEVSYPEKEPFQKATKSMYEDFKKDPVIATLIEQIQNEKN